LTLALAAAAAGSAALVAFDPWAGKGAAAPFYSASSAARRVFPDLGEPWLPRATITLARVGAAPVRIEPGGDGLHVVWSGDRRLGWADAEAVDGLWSSLRMATTLRAVAEGSEIGPARGEIAVEVEGTRRAATLHGDASDGVGVYGTIAGAGTWVVEPELAAALAQPAEAWLSRRLLPVEASDAASVKIGGLEIARGADGLWRVQAGGPAHLLAESAVALRLDRIVAAEFEPLAGGEDMPVQPWLEVQDRGGRRFQVALGGACPGEPGRRVAERGPGVRGCVEADIDAPWPVADPDSGLVEPQLVPYAYGRVLAIQQDAPARRRLRRLGGGWVIEEDGSIVEVAEPEVFRWWSALQGAPVDVPSADLSDSFTMAVDLTVEADSGQSLRLRCGPAGAAALACRRDEGPPLLVGRGELALAFARETFADRRLLSFQSGEARELEILPGPGRTEVRQSVRLDLGVWRLDAPEHPDGAAALDEVRLEAMLAALQGVRAEAWIEAPSTAPMRTLRVERTGGKALTLELYDGCVGHVPGEPRAAALAAGTCAAVGDDLLYNDPLRAWLGQARRVELTAGERAATAAREGEGEAFTTSGDAGLLANLATWEAFRSAGIDGDEPRGAPSAVAKIHRPGAATITVEVGPVVDGTPAWARLRGAAWHYVQAPAEGTPEP
jgi:hypothetical protein